MELCYCCLSLFVRVSCSIVAFSDFICWLGIRKNNWCVRKFVLATCKDFSIEVLREPNSWWVWKTWPVKQKPREGRRKSSISLCIYSHRSEHWGSLDMWNVKIILIGSYVVQQQWREAVRMPEETHWDELRMARKALFCPERTHRFGTSEEISRQPMQVHVDNSS